MKCKACNNKALEKFNYCNQHLCNKTKRDGTRCKKKKFKGKDFCFSHQYSNEKVVISLAIIAILLAVIFPLRTLFICPKLHYFCFGSLEIDFKENDITIHNDIPSVKIEVLNNIGYPLLNVNGTATLICENLNREINSQIFQLEGGRDFLANGAKSELLLSPDPFFVDLIKTRDYIKEEGYGCSDATFITGEYKKINETHAKLMEVNIYDFLNDQEPIKAGCGVNDAIVVNTCLYCNITTEIYASNKNKKFSKTETHKFIGFQTIINPFNDIIKSGSMGDSFYMSIFGYFSSFKLCNGITNDECDTLLCNEVKKLGSDISCQKGKDKGSQSFPPFTKGVISPPNSCE